MTAITDTSPGPTIEMNTMHIRISGIASSVSVNRMISWSRSPPAKPGDHPERRADGHVQRDRTEPDDERDPGAVHDPGEDVAARQVRSQEVALAGRLADRAVVGQERVQRDEQRQEDGGRHDRHEDQEPDDRQPVTQEPPDRLASQALVVARDDLARIERHGDLSGRGHTGSVGRRPSRRSRQGCWRRA